MRDLRTWLFSISEEARDDNLKTLCLRYANTGNIAKLLALLTNFEFLDIKISRFGIQEVFADFNRLSHPHIIKSPEYNAKEVAAVRSIQQALQKSSSVLQADNQELSSRLWGHLGREQSSWIQKLLLQAVESKAKSDKPIWLRPLEPNLSVPGSPLEATLTGHNGHVTSLAVTSDSSTLITGSYNQIKIWNLAALTNYTIDFSSDDSVLRKYDQLIFDDIFKSLVHERYVKTLAITLDDSIAISGSSDGVLRVWDLKSRKILQRQEIICSQFATDNDESLRDQIKLSKRLGKTIEPYNAINALALIPESSCVVVGCEDGAVYLYNIKFGTLYTFAYSHPSSVNSVVASADGELVITGSEEAIYIWNRITDKINLFQRNSSSLQDSYFPYIGCTNDLAMTLNKCRLVNTRLYKVCIWDLVSHNCLFELNHSKTVRSATLTPDGKKVIVGEALGDVVVWDLSENVSQQVSMQQQPKNSLLSRLRNFFNRSTSSKQKDEECPQTGKKLATLKGHAYRVNAVTVTPDGKYAISGADEAKLWRLDRLSQPSESLAQHDWTVHGVTVSSDGKYLASSQGTQIKIWDLPTRTIFCTIFAGYLVGDTGCVLITPDNQRLVAGSLSAINFYNLETGEKEDSVFVQGSLIHALSMSSDGKRLVSGGDCQAGFQSGDTLRLWDIGSSKAKQIGTLGDDANGKRKSILDVAITPDGKQALSIALKDKMITVWNFETKEVIKTLPNDCYSPFVLTPDGNYVITTSPLVFTVIDLEKGQKVAEVPPKDDRLGGQRHHFAPVTGIAVAPNGQWFVSVSRDSTIKVWELATGYNLAKFRCESNPFTCCTVAPDNCTIIAGDVSGQVHFFKLEGVADGLPVLRYPHIVDSLDQVEIDAGSSKFALSSKPNYEVGIVESSPLEISLSDEINSESAEAVYSSSEEYLKHLSTLLAEQNWEEANKKTIQRLLTRNILDAEELKVIDTLWVKHSNYRFGLSIQKRIWEEVDRNSKKFCHRVGWNASLGNISNSETSINFSLSAPEGHLPVRSFQTNNYFDDSLHLLQQIFSCLDTFFPITVPYPVLLKGLPNRRAYLQLQAEGTGVFDFRLYLSNHLFDHREISCSRDKNSNSNVIIIPLPSNLCKESLSGSLTIKHLRC